MKRSFALFFLSLFLLNMAGTYFYFFLRLREIKSEMREALQEKPVEELETLRLTEEEFGRAKVDDHELKIQGRMYDIARVEKKGKTIFVYCLHDDDEDNLLSLLDAILKNATKDKKPVPGSSLTQLVASDCFYPVINSQNVSFHLVVPNTFYCINQSNFAPPITVPPPRG